MIILGGTYSERCQRPKDARLRGSGLRAAIALRSLAASLELHTAVHPRERPELDIVVSAYGDFPLVVHERSAPISFDYFTPLSPPAIDGLGARIGGDFSAESNTVLRFGMLETPAPTTIRARTLVVDPQGDADELPLDGATHERLAIVANERETHRLSGESDLRVAIQTLRVKAGADVVVAKCGARGALVATSDGIESVGCFRTAHVVPIGSGDVFAAAFAWAFGERGDDPVPAARFASRSAAHWCASPAEPALQSSYVDLPELPFGERPRVYVAGPFFGLGQSWLVDLARAALRELGSNPFSPFHDVGPGGPEVAIADLAGLDESTAVLALLDEFDPGTLFEVGYAVRNRVPVVGYLDPRPSDHLVMLEGSGVEVVTDLASAVYRVIWRGMSPS